MFELNEFLVNGRVAGLEEADAGDDEQAAGYEAQGEGGED